MEPNPEYFPFGIYGRPAESGPLWYTVDGDVAEPPFAEFDTDRKFEMTLRLKIPRMALVTGSHAYTIRVNGVADLPENRTLERAYVREVVLEGSTLCNSNNYGIQVLDANRRSVLGSTPLVGAARSDLWWMCERSSDMMRTHQRACCGNELETYEYAHLTGGVDPLLGFHGNIRDSDLPDNLDEGCVSTAISLKYLPVMRWGLESLLAEAAWRDNMLMCSPQERTEIRKDGSGFFEMDTDWAKRIVNMWRVRKRRVGLMLRNLNTVHVTVADVSNEEEMSTTEEVIPSSCGPVLVQDLLVIRIVFNCGQRLTRRVKQSGTRRGTRAEN